MTNPSYEFFAGGGAYAKFETPGTTVTGTITDEEQRITQQTEMGTGKPRTYDDGNPMMQLIVNLQTEERDPDIEEDDGRRDLYIKGQLKVAVQQALRKAQSKGLDVGGVLSVTYTHDETTHAGFKAKHYVAVYTPPTETFFGTTEAANGEAMPPGMTRDVWVSLTPEARAALSGLVAK